MKSCPQCGKQYPDSEGFCEVDGTALVAAPDSPRGRLTTVMHDEIPAEQGLECPVCGGKALPGEIRCNYCGARLPAEGSRVKEPPSAEASDFENFDSAARPSGPQAFDEAPVYAPEPESTEKGRRFFTILGLSSAAVVALAAGAWFALYLGNKRPSHQASSSVATSQPTVELARQMPLRVQSDNGGPASRGTDSLLKAFEHNKAGLANVYSNTLNSSPSMSDGMLVRLHILPDGSVDNGAVKISTSGNPSFDAEIVEAMTSWKFSSISGSGVTADYPVIFAPSTSAAAAVESDLNSKLASLSPNESPEYAFAPSTATPSAVSEASPTSMPRPAAGTSTMPSTAVAVGTPVPAAEPTTVAGLEPTPSAATHRAAPAEMMPSRPRLRRHRRPPREMAALPPPKPPLIERVNAELRANHKLRRVRAYTNGSVVTIFGKVFDDNDRLLAERTVRSTDGVSAVINNLTTDTQQWKQNQTLITQALQNAGLNDVQVKVIGRSAYLSGQVKTALDRERAVTIAQAAAPVKVRENLITVAMGNILGF